MIICPDNYPHTDLMIWQKIEIKFTLEYLQTTKVLLTVWSRTSSKSNVVTEIVANREEATTAVILETEEVMKVSMSNEVA